MAGSRLPFWLIRGISMTYASVADVATRWGKLISELTTYETTLIPARLTDAERLIRSRIPDLDDRITSGVLDEELVKLVEAEAVLRVVRNPEGYSQESDGSYSYSRSTRVASGTLDILPEEWALLGAPLRGMFTITPRMPTRPRRVPFDHGG